MSLCFVSFCSGVSNYVVEKFVKLDESGNITFGIFGKEINSLILSIIPGKDINEFANNLK